jgi:hypothetical protein
MIDENRSIAARINSPVSLSTFFKIKSWSFFIENQRLSLYLPTTDKMPAEKTRTAIVP